MLFKGARIAKIDDDGASEVSGRAAEVKDIVIKEVLKWKSNVGLENDGSTMVGHMQRCLLAIF